MGFFGAPRRGQLPEPLGLGETAAPSNVAAATTGAFDSRGELDQNVAQAAWFAMQPGMGGIEFAPAQAIPLDQPALAAEAADWTPDDDLNRRDVQIIGNGFQVNGTLTTGRFGRLSDWLNMQAGWIHVADGVLFRPGDDEHEAEAKPRASQWVRLDEVVLVAEHQPEQRTPGAAPGWVRKERRRVTLVTHGYVLRGYMHLVQSGTMQSFLESPSPHFIPMTDVVVRWLADEGLVSHLPFALINRGQLISVSEEQRQEAADTVSDRNAQKDAGPAPAWLRSA